MNQTKNHSGVEAKALSRREILGGAGAAAGVLAMPWVAALGSASRAVAGELPAVGASVGQASMPLRAASGFSLHLDKTYFDASGLAEPYQSSRPLGAVGFGAGTSETDWRRGNPFG